MNYTYRLAELSELNKIMEIYVSAQQFMEHNGNPQWPAGFPGKVDVTGGILGGILYTVTYGGEIAAVFSAMNYDGDYDEIECTGWRFPINSAAKARQNIFWKRPLPILPESAAEAA